MILILSIMLFNLQGQQQPALFPPQGGFVQIPAVQSMYITTNSIPYPAYNGGARPQGFVPTTSFPMQMGPYQQYAHATQPQASCKYLKCSCNVHVLNRHFYTFSSNFSGNFNLAIFIHIY